MSVNRPDCCDGMRDNLHSDRGNGIVVVRSVDGDACYDHTSAGPYVPLLSGVGVFLEWSGHPEVYFRIRYCPWCGTEIDAREKL